MNVSDIMSVHPVHVDEKATIEDVAKLLSTGQINSVIITNENKVSGIVTTIDLVKLLFKKD
jgi:CBS domain-containing protein